MNFVCSFFMFVGRLCMATIFLLSGIAKFAFYDATAQEMVSKGLPMVPVLLVVSALIEIIGALCLIFGFKTRFGATLLILYLIPVTYFMQDFWNVQEAGLRLLQTIMFLKNLAIIGGLIFIDCVGAGSFACDSWCRSCKRDDVKHL